MHPVAEELQSLQTLLIARATGRFTPDDDMPYMLHRRRILGDLEVSALLPGWLKTHRTLEHFWLFIKPKFSSYEERKTFIYEQLVPAFDFLDRQGGFPSDGPVDEALERFDAEHVTSA